MPAVFHAEGHPNGGERTAGAGVGVNGACRGETPRPCTPGRFVPAYWGVFYEKAPNVKAALAAFLMGLRSYGLSPSLLSALSRSPSLDSVHDGVPPPRPISTAASKAKTPSAVADN